jgi:hypothetical protein
VLHFRCFREAGGGARIGSLVHFRCFRSRTIGSFPHNRLFAAEHGAGAEHLAGPAGIEAAEQVGENRECPVKDVEGALGGMEGGLPGDFGREQGCFRRDQTPFVPGGSGHGSHGVEGDGGFGAEFSHKVVEDLREFGDTRVVGREVAGIEIVPAAVLRGAALALGGFRAAGSGAIGAGGGLSEFRYHPGLIVHRRRSEFGGIFR